MSSIELPDAVHAMLCERIETLEAERDALITENERMRSGVREARIYAGERLPPREGLVVVHLLEAAMKEGAK